MRDSNPTTIKFLKSNYEYYTKNNISEIINEIEKEVEENFNPVKLFQHYTKTAESQYYKYLSNHLTDGQERYEIKE